MTKPVFMLSERLKKTLRPEPRPYIENEAVNVYQLIVLRLVIDPHLLDLVISQMAFNAHKI